MLYNIKSLMIYFNCKTDAKAQFLLIDTIIASNNL